MLRCGRLLVTDCFWESLPQNSSWFCEWVLPIFVCESSLLSLLSSAVSARAAAALSGLPLSLQLPLWIPSVILPFRHCSSHSALRIVHPGASECWPKFGAEELSGMAKVRVSRKEWQLHVMHHLWRNWTVNILFQSKNTKRLAKTKSQNWCNIQFKF